MFLSGVLEFEIWRTPLCSALIKDYFMVIKKYSLSLIQESINIYLSAHVSAKIQFLNKHMSPKFALY